MAQLRDVLRRTPLVPDRPTAIICHTIKGKGIPFVENNLKWHHKSRVTPEEIASLMAALEDN